MSKKKKQGRVIGRRRDVSGQATDLVFFQATDLVFFGPPELRAQYLERFGGIEGLRQLMRDACPICSAGGRHDQIGYCGG